jgi:molybdenum cofactor cytidylyltransferase
VEKKMKLRLIYLAAGNSRRFGSNKLLYELEGKPLYLHLLERLDRLCARHDGWEVIAVTQYPQIYDEVRAENIRAVFSPDSHKGVSYSIRAGLEAAADAQACAFFVADQPYLTEESAEAFLENMERNQAELGCVICGDQTGNPAWFSRNYFPELVELKEDQGGRKVLKKYPDQTAYFLISDAEELQDIDLVP